MRTCPFSNSPPIQTKTGHENLQHVFDAPRAGGRYITKQGFDGLASKISEMSEKERARLVTVLVDLRRVGQEEPELTFDLIAKAKMKPDLSRVERFARLLEFLVRESNDQMGAKVDLYSDRVYPLLLAWIESTTPQGVIIAKRLEAKTAGKPIADGEVGFLCDYLASQNLITYRDQTKSSVTVTMDGYLRLEEEGVSGEGLSCSASERERAQSLPGSVLINSEHVEDLDVNQDSSSGHPTAHSHMKSERVEAFLVELSNKVGELELSKDQESSLVSAIRTIKAQAGSPKPNARIVGEGLSSIGRVLEGASGSVAPELSRSLGELRWGD